MHDPSTLIFIIYRGSHELFGRHRIQRNRTMTIHVLIGATPGGHATALVLGLLGPHLNDKWQER